MTALANLLGRTFGSLTVDERAGNSKAGRARWLCVCACGRYCIVLGNNLLRGRQVSCGCVRDANRTKHGHHPRGLASPTYTTWKAMISRCTYATHKHWRHYGGRGIAVCARWRLFENFLADMGERPAGTSIDRINVNGNYEPSNCRWATDSEQRVNQRPRRAA